MGVLLIICLLADVSTVFAWEKQVKQHGRKPIWFVVVLSTSVLLRGFFLFVLMSLFCLAVSSEASLPAQNAQTFPCTETSGYTTQDQTLHAVISSWWCHKTHPKPPRRWVPKPKSDLEAPDHQAKAQTQIAVPFLLCSPFSNKPPPLIRNLTPSPRQLHVAEGEGEREITVVTGDNYSKFSQSAQCIS